MNGWGMSRGPAWALAAFVFALSGCAVQSGPRGQIHVGLDDAELFGQVVDSFRLPDGSEGKLRLLAGRYSVKLPRQFKVVPIANATRVRVVSTRQVGGRTLVVLEKSERNCASKTQLMSILGAEVLSWDFGDCQNQPETAADEQQALFDFVQPRRTVRYTYRDARLMRGEFPTPPSAPPELPAPADPASARRHQPGPPVNAGTPPRRPAAAPGGNAATATAPPTPRRALPPAPTPAPRPEFAAQEQKPVRIVLD